jgi:hypothetical protein
VVARNFEIGLYKFYFAIHKGGGCIIIHSSTITAH